MPARTHFDWRLRVLLLLVAVVLAAVFLVPANWLIGAPDTDLAQQFLTWRAFAAASLHSGHLPLWNPYTYSGQPFLAGFQSAVFYPPNLLFVVLPLCRAVNLSLLLHLLLLGVGMHRLARQRGLHPLAAFTAGCVLPLSGAVFPHLYAGHLSNLCTMAWTPWILAGSEDWQRRRKLSGLLLASAAVAAQILAGQVQYVYYTAIAAGLQALVATAATPASRRRALPGLVAIYLGGALLAAAQLFPGLAAAEENLRQAKLDYAFVSIFGFPLENLLTAVVPGFFGDLHRHIYWGRDYLWEMTIFMGITSLAFVVIGLGDRPHRRAVRLDLGLAAFLLLLAFGSQTPLLRLFYEVVPGFDRFRGLSKFTFPALIYLGLAAAAGVDALVAGRLPPRRLALALLLAGAAGLVAGGLFWRHPGFVAHFFRSVLSSNESYLPAAAFTNLGFARAAGLQTSRALFQAGAVCLLLAGCLGAAHRRPVWRWGLFPLLALELMAFARSHSSSFRDREVMPQELRAFVAAHPGDYRVLNQIGANNGFLLGTPDVWGNDPGLLKRYAEFIAFTQGADPDHASQLIPFHSFPKILSLLRLRFDFHARGRALDWVEYYGALPRIQLVSDYRVLPDRDRLFAAMKDPTFDPRRTVLLESEPEPRPDRGPAPGEVRLLEAEPDALSVEAALSRPAILLITDPYSRDWQVRPLFESDPRTYQLLPADYVVRAVPLAAGHHFLRIEYHPAGFRAGVLVSLVAWLAWMVAAWHRRQLRSKRLPDQPAQDGPEVAGQSGIGVAHPGHG